MLPELSIRSLSVLPVDIPNIFVLGKYKPVPELPVNEILGAAVEPTATETTPPDTFVDVVAVPVILIPQVPEAFVPVTLGDPIVLYETVTGEEPLNPVPETAPEPLLLNVIEFDV